MSRPVELFLASILFIATLPFQGITWILICLRIGRPVFFRQVRQGRSARPFTIVKFRTMTEERGPDGRLLPDHLRQIPMSRLIRRLRLDELPQLVLILRGDMALVGPRPLLPETIAGFGEAGRRRCMVAPGLTGWAQVSGNTRLDDAQKLALDLWYVDHRSTMLDLRILVETVAVALRGEHPHPERLSVAQQWLAAQGIPA
ncbi:sugar transferase [Paracoccus benzoatiresistens]|uniref:Sugar transferase n=1 Tax=Paracoccus benzoatiresistens TaxID=2997341 RepID=A0ABT4J2H1_9RHOB|nr:sugar transferase [Paracoccus sp. EF6]MCZ0960626.1 sugar transferase [Paracoccus sp. EF6]